MSLCGDPYVRVICSVCQGKYYRKDTVLVRDKYSYQNGLIVCKWDLDKINAQSYPNRDLKDLPPSNPKHLTGPCVITYADVVIDDRAPSAPYNPYALPAVNVDEDNIGVELYWEAPLNQGSSDIIGYLIERADPQLGVYEVITSNSQSSTPYYNDTTANTATFYSYRIKAINSYGSSPYSVEFFYPVKNVPWDDIEYITDGVGNIIMGGDGYLLRSSHTNEGVM